MGRMIWFFLPNKEKRFLINAGQTGELAYVPISKQKGLLTCAITKTVLYLEDNYFWTEIPNRIRWLEEKR